MTSVLGARRPRATGDGGPSPVPAAGTRPLVVTGAIAAVAASGTGLVVLTLLVLIGWIAAPHAGTGLTGVLRAAAALWLVSHHVGFTLRGAGRIGLLPLGLVLLPGALAWRAGQWVVSSGGVRRLRHVGYAAITLAVPYALISGALALASASTLAAPSPWQAVIAGFLLAMTAGGLGGLRALAPWRQLTALLPVRARSVILGSTGALAVVMVAGSLLAGVSLARHLGQFASVNSALAPGLVGVILLLLVQLAYVPNAVIWAVSYMLGPGFAFGAGTVVAPTGSALGSLPSFPLLAALPSGAHGGLPPALTAAVLAMPYVAGVFGGLLMARSAPSPALEIAPLWGFASGALAGVVTGALAAFAGGPLGDGRLSVVGPSGWEVAVIAALEIGIAAAITAGLANWFWMRPSGSGSGAGLPAAEPSPPAVPLEPASDDGGHTIYLDPWAGEDGDGTARGAAPASHGPSDLP